MKYFIIDELGIKHRYPYEAQGGGTGAAALENTYTAGAAVIRDRLLMIAGGKVIHFEPGDENNAGKLVGISHATVAANEPVTLTSAGFRSSPAWGLVPNAVYYAAANGGITITPPVTGICLRVGVAVTATTMQIELSEPVILI